MGRGKGRKSKGKGEKVVRDLLLSDGSSATREIGMLRSLKMKGMPISEGVFVTSIQSNGATASFGFTLTPASIETAFANTLFPRLWAHAGGGIFTRFRPVAFSIECAPYVTVPSTAATGCGSAGGAYALTPAGATTGSFATEAELLNFRESMLYHPGAVPATSGAAGPRPFCTRKGVAGLQINLTGTDELWVGGTGAAPTTPAFANLLTVGVTTAVTNSFVILRMKAQFMGLGAAT